MPANHRDIWVNVLVLVGVFIAVHLVYIGLIRPQAELVIEAARQAGQSAPRNLFVILKDLEQEICIVLMIYGLYLMAVRYTKLVSRRYLFTVDLLQDAGADRTGLGTVLEELEKLPGHITETPLVETLKASLRRYLITRDVQNTSDAINASVEAQGVRLEAENSTIRYLIWAIPSVGFIGTVRGIGQALSQAEKALAGDIATMTDSLGVAFNSTFVALLISIFLMFFLHQLQRAQDGVLVETQAYCEKFLLNRISS
ncbi:MAG: MotA/TolQ/ExbB proton channel family protein [Gammaproteobacteria bacterium]|nr:MotA/TolQ/ExbB proton channel family protein [Gammaproteobacteria bacterium]MDD9808161.1 MotA/TolQ/ExbB proton channel family protein [Gammaproteobacteria bacterium]MDD9869515.1 MotA/TolQ/ExbB proton channel family protein [Gammaproteobacteria bacterium]MDD9886972.1 MotA/TolQ/ExbB proton channel family protein [Gammaproteobacteria bacterium]